MDRQPSYRHQYYRSLSLIMRPYHPIMVTPGNLSLVLTDMPINYNLYRERAEAAGIETIVSIRADQLQYFENVARGNIRQLFVSYYESIPEVFVPQWLDLLESTFRVRDETHFNTLAVHSHNRQAAILVAIAMIENGIQPNRAIHVVESYNALNNLEREFLYNYQPSISRRFGEYMRIE